MMWVPLLSLLLTVILYLGEPHSSAAVALPVPYPFGPVAAAPFVATTVLPEFVKRTGLTKGAGRFMTQWGKGLTEATEKFVKEAYRFEGKGAMGAARFGGKKNELEKVASVLEGHGLTPNPRHVPKPKVPQSRVPPNTLVSAPNTGGMTKGQVALEVGMNAPFLIPMAGGGAAAEASTTTAAATTAATHPHPRTPKQKRTALVQTAMNDPNAWRAMKNHLFPSSSPTGKPSEAVVERLKSMGLST